MKLKLPAGNLGLLSIVVAGIVILYLAVNWAILSYKHFSDNSPTLIEQTTK